MGAVRIENAKELAVGDKFEFTCSGKGRGGHYRVFAEVTKVNRTTVNATELPRSYRPGTLWNVSVGEDYPVFKQI